MTTYNVIIAGQQSHITNLEFNNQSISDVENVLNKYWDEDYPKPKFDGGNWELNNDQIIRIEQVSTAEESI